MLNRAAITADDICTSFIFPSKLFGMCTASGPLAQSVHSAEQDAVGPE